MDKKVLDVRYTLVNGEEIDFRVETETYEMAELEYIGSVIANMKEWITINQDNIIRHVRTSQIVQVTYCRLIEGEFPTKFFEDMNS